MQEKQYNNISPKLRSFLPKLKPGEKLKFQLNGIYVDPITKKLVCPTSFNMASIDRIYDPWARVSKKGVGKNEDEYEGDYVDIAFINREQPASADSPRATVIEFGRVEFLRTNAGIIEVIGGNRQKEKVMLFLFFNNRNTTNIGKPWFVKPIAKAIYHLIETTKAAKQDLRGELKVDQAKAAITEMTDEEVKTATAGLFPNTYNGLNQEQKILKLRTIANKNPDKILDLSKNVEVKTTAFIEECLKAELIDLNNDKKQFIWHDDQTEICSIKPGSTPHNSLKKYFMTEEGVEVLEALERQLALAKASKKDKTEKAVV
jgi:hypothetical protein